MNDLVSRLKPLLEASDIEGITALLETWPQRDALWEQCVEARAYAPSSNAEQRQRLRDLLKAHVGNRPQQNCSELHAAAKAERLPPTTQSSPAPMADRLSLPELQQALDATAARLPSLPAALAPLASEVLEHTRQQNLAQQAQRWEQYQEELRRRRQPNDANFEAFLTGLASHFVQLGPAATDAELAALESIMPGPIDPELSAFYRVFGGLRGEFGNEGISLHLFSPRELLAAHGSTERWRRLDRVSLLDMARWSWGNDRPELDPGELCATTADIAGRTVCAGWLSDGSCEQHAYLVLLASGGFALHLWHQDTQFEAPSANRSNGRGLLELVAAALAAVTTTSPEAEPLADLDALMDVLAAQ